MTPNLIPVKTFLGKFYTELNNTVQTSQKYKNTNIDTFFEQRFHIQNNKVQMVVDVHLSGLRVIVSGNEIHVSKELYKHPFIDITNSIEEKGPDPKSLYSTGTFSTIAYLICQNHTLFKVMKDIEEPIYITFKSDYESFYNSVLLFMVNSGATVNVVEEIESHCAINSVVNYILNPYSVLNVSTFYRNQKPTISFFFRNVIAQTHSVYNHLLLGKGSSNIVDENRIVFETGVNLELNGKIDVSNSSFHSIIEATSSQDDNSIVINYKSSARNKGHVTVTPVVETSGITTADISVQSLIIDDTSSIIIAPTFNTPASPDLTVSNIADFTLDDEELKQMLSDGVEDDEAKQLLITKFSGDIADRIGISSTQGTELYHEMKNRFFE
jgi:SUF system FeS cluster assembly, SufBD